MSFQLQISTLQFPKLEPPAKPANEVADLLRQMLQLQKEQLDQLRFLTALLDHSARWRQFAEKLNKEQPELAKQSKQAIRSLEQSYGMVLNDLAENLSDRDDEPLGSDYQLQEFLDRYGVRLGHLANILNALRPIGDMADQSPK